MPCSLSVRNVWPVHSLGPSEQKPVKNFGERGAWTYPGTAQIFGVPPIISGMGKATKFKFCRCIHRINRNKSPLKISGKSSRGRSQGLPKIFRAFIYRAHRAVIFVIAQLSCWWSDGARFLKVISGQIRIEKVGGTLLPFPRPSSPVPFLPPPFSHTFPLLLLSLLALEVDSCPLNPAMGSGRAL